MTMLEEKTKMAEMTIKSRDESVNVKMMDLIGVSVDRSLLGMWEIKPQKKDPKNGMTMTMEKIMMVVNTP